MEQIYNLGLLYPGQGSQYVGMGMAFYAEHAVARDVFAEASDVLGIDMVALCRDGSRAELMETGNAQPALLTVNVAAFRVYVQDIGLAPRTVAGHSAGELSALTCAGVVPFSTALEIIRKRALLMRQAGAVNRGAMAAIIGPSAPLVEQECARVSRDDCCVTVANYNSPVQTVIAGHCPGVQEVSHRLQGSGATVIPLSVSGPFHSPLMKSASDEFRAFLKSITFAEAQWDVISNVTAHPFADTSDVAEQLSRQIVEPVRWRQSLAYMNSLGVDTWLELGPNGVLKGLTRENLPGAHVFAYDKEDDRRPFSEMVCASIKRILDKSLATVAATRNRNFNNEEFAKGVVQPYREAKTMIFKLEEANAAPTSQQLEKAVKMLRTALHVKGVPKSEQNARLAELLRLSLGIAPGGAAGGKSRPGESHEAPVLTTPSSPRDLRSAGHVREYSNEP